MAKDVEELLYDSEAALRQVDSALFIMTGEAPPPPAEPSATPRARPLPVGDLGSIVAHGHQELLRVLQDLSRERTRSPAADDANQRLQHAAAVFAELEDRLTSVLNGLSPAVSAFATRPPTYGLVEANHEEHPVAGGGMVVPPTIDG